MGPGAQVSFLRHSLFRTPPALFLSSPDSFIQCAPWDACGAKTDLASLSRGAVLASVVPGPAELVGKANVPAPEAESPGGGAVQPGR